MNPHIDWGGMPIEIPSNAKTWARGSKPRVAGVSAFGFSGTNAHVVVEEAPPEVSVVRVTDRPQHILALSARTETALQELGNRYADVLEHSRFNLGDLCFTANAGRTHFEHRVAVTGTSVAEICTKLLEALPGERVREREGLRPVFLFPGQGAQYSGMGQELYETQPVFRAALDTCAELLRSELERPLLEVLWGNATELLQQTAYTQSALFAVEYATAELWKSWGIVPAGVLGHSVGEYVAACIAGVYNLADGLKLIAARGRLMQGLAGEGAMLAVLANEAQVAPLLKGLETRVTIAALNAPASIVLSGFAHEIAVAENRLRGARIAVQRLAVSHGFHSPQMAQMEAKFGQVVSALPFATPRLQLISSVTGHVCGRSELSEPVYWRRQVMQPVRFQAALETSRDLGHHTFLEVGPGNTLAGFGRQTLGRDTSFWGLSFKKGRAESGTMLDTLRDFYNRGAQVNWNGFDAPFARHRVALPTYPFQRQRYWAELKSSTAKHDAVNKSEERTQTPAAVIPCDGSLFKLEWETKQRAPGTTVAGDWLILADRGALGPSVAKRLEAEGSRCVLVQQPISCAEALSKAAWRGVVCLFPVDVKECSNVAVEALCGSTLELIQALAQGAENAPPRLWIVTRGAQMAAARQSSIQPAQTSVWGMAQAIREEHPEWRCVMVDLDPAASDTDAAELCAEVGGIDREDQIAFREGRRLVARLAATERPIRLEPVVEAPPTVISPQATYLITGGFGGLGLHLLKWLAEQGARNIALVGRSGATDTARAVIQEAEAAGVRIQCFRADVSRKEDMAQVLALIGKTHAPLRGVFHTAGVLADAALTQQTAESFARVFAPKVAGTVCLDELTAEIPLDFFVLFSSAASLLGAAGQANYAAASAFEDAMSHRRRLRGLPAISVNWGAWAAGMAQRTATEQRRHYAGMAIMQPVSALSLLGQILHAQPAQILAASMDWNRLAQRFANDEVPPRYSHRSPRFDRKRQPTRNLRCSTSCQRLPKRAASIGYTAISRQSPERCSAFPPGGPSIPNSL